MKRCLLVCEGPNDELIFSILKDIFDNNKFEIKPYGGCCLDTNHLLNNVSTKLKSILKKDHTYTLEDFDEISFLVDTDGIYIDEKYVIKDTKSSIDYSLSSISCKERKSVITRNNIRRNNIDELMKSGEYHIFYNSRNLEHSLNPALISNLTDQKKSSFAKQIIMMYSSDPKAFIETLFSNNKSGTYCYKQSWDYVKSDFNSLSSCSNICIFILLHFQYLKSEYKE